MSRLFKIIETGIDVSKILKQVHDNSQDWKEIKKICGISGNIEVQTVIPLTLGVTDNSISTVNVSEQQFNTPLYRKYTEMTKWLYDKGFKDHSRAAFFKLYVGGDIMPHREVTSYYTTRDRYHLSLQGTYNFWVGDENYIITPGTFFWFDNKESHSAYNIGENERISFVWDAPMRENNPYLIDK